MGGVHWSLRTASDCNARRLHNGRRPLVAAHRKRLQRANLTFHELSAFAVTFINDENVGDLHDSGFDGLHIVAHAGDEDHNGDIGHAHYVNFILADANGFNHDEVAAGGVEHSGYVGGCASQSAERAARSHAADVNAGIGKMLLHADAVAQNRSACVRAGGIDSNDADRAVFFAVMPRQLVDQSALAGAGSAGHTQNARVAGVGEKSFQQIGPSGSAILDRTDDTGQRTRIAIPV